MIAEPAIAYRLVESGEIREAWHRSAVGERGKWSGERREAHSTSQPERNARRRVADGSRRFCGNSANATRDERAVCVVERTASRGGTRPTGSP